jgi:hypothetical protein
MRVYQIIIDPIINGQKLSKYYKVDVKKLHNEVLQEWSSISGEKYEIVKSITVDYIPEKEDGYKYTREEYYRILMGEIQGHSPDFMSYKLFIEKFDLIDGKNKEEFDEVHVYGAPWFGFYESRMIGKTSIWCNSPEYKSDNENFIIMGFNYERGISEAIEAFGHRVESTLNYCYPKFFKTLKDKVGTIHIPFNATTDYDWKNKSYKDNVADSLPKNYSYKKTSIFTSLMNLFRYRTFNYNSGEINKTENCEKWGCGSLGWFRYWFSRIPSYMWRMIIHVDEIKKVESIFN